MSEIHAIRTRIDEIERKLRAHQGGFAIPMREFVALGDERLRLVAELQRLLRPADPHEDELRVEEAALDAASSFAEEKAGKAEGPKFLHLKQGYLAGFAAGAAWARKGAK